MEEVLKMMTMVGCPGPSLPYMACLGYSGPISYPGARSLLIRHAWDTVDLYPTPGPVVSSYDMPGIQWTYILSPGP